MKKEMFSLNRIELGSLSVSVLVVLILLVIQNNSLPPQIPLFFGMPSGITQLAPKFVLIILPVIAIAVLIINHIAILIIKDKFIQKLFLLATTIACFMMAYAVFQVFNLVGIK
jgi:hypothetical protein